MRLEGWLGHELDMRDEVALGHPQGCQQVRVQRSACEKTCESQLHRGGEQKVMGVMPGERLPTPPGRDETTRALSQTGTSRMK